VVRSRERQRQLARARWERQQARRTAAQRRNRRISIVVGVIVALVAAAALVWLILNIVDTEDTRDQTPTLPIPAPRTETGVTAVVSPPTTGPPTTRPRTGNATGSSERRSGSTGRSTSTSQGQR
jgi:peptidyl-prolyl cis-trans isomerase B (cyclophilin B)